MIRELRDPSQKRSWWIFHLSGYIISPSNDFTVAPHEEKKKKKTEMYILLFFQSWLSRITCWDSSHTPEGTLWWEIDWCEEVWCCKAHAEKKPLWLSLCFVLSIEQQGELVGQKLRVGKLAPCELRASAEGFFLFFFLLRCGVRASSTTQTELHFFLLRCKKKRRRINSAAFFIALSEKCELERLASVATSLWYTHPKSVSRFLNTAYFVLHNSNNGPLFRLLLSRKLGIQQLHISLNSPFQSDLKNMPPSGNIYIYKKKHSSLCQ